MQALEFIELKLTFQHLRLGSSGIQKMKIGEGVSYGFMGSKTTWEMT